MRTSLLLRRAVIHTLMAASPQALSIHEITRRILARRPVDELLGPLTPKRMSDMLRFQASQGRVRRASTGHYVWVPTETSRVTEWRYRTWPRLFDDIAAARAAAVE